MSVPPERIEVGKCYLMESGQVRRVLRIMPDGRFQYEHRMGHAAPKGLEVGYPGGPLLCSDRRARDPLRLDA